ncbi:MAG: S8 family peptidase [Flavobacteriales bacterium]|nr:S8 family peptidase [Flavobacteriales bacterium]
MKHILLFILLPFLSFAQNELSETHTAIFFNTNVDKATQLALLNKYSVSDLSDISEFRYKPYVFVPKGAVDTEALLLEPAVDFISPVQSNTKHQFVTYLPNFFVHLNNANDMQLLEREAEKLGISIVGPNRYMENIIELTTNKNGINPIDAVKALKATGWFRTVSPNLVHSVSDCSVNDPRFDKQWNLKNEGTSLQGNGTVGADMDVEAAWNITTGSSDITIVIVDSGIDTLHPELEGKLLPGFDAMSTDSTDTKGYPTPNFDSDGHGTSCAGIAAANTNNNLGVAGVCQNCKVVPVRVFHYEVILGQVQPWSETAFFLAAMGWQSQADIDVSSNSWAVPDILLALYPGSDTLVNAVIDEVVDNGRGGLGVPMLFSSGNDGITDTIPLWPARYEKTIAVGATSMCDEQKTASSCDGETWWAGNWGTGLDVSAPGVRVATIDMLGGNGFSNTQYYDSFNGTSAACPNAAGVMALMLSQTPGLPEWLARKSLAMTSEKVGGYDYSTWKENGGWSKELGYGRVNAFNAVTYGASAVGDLSTERNVLIETYTDKHILRVSDNSMVEWSLFDMNGRLIKSGSGKETINLSHQGLMQGIYAIRLKGTEFFETVKLFIP